jgi:hypothetical protein
MKKTIIAAVVITMAAAEDDGVGTSSRPSLRTVIPLAVTSLLVGSVSAQSKSCLEWAGSIWNNQPGKLVTQEWALNVSQVVGVGYLGKPILGKRLVERNCTTLSLPEVQPSLGVLVCCEKIPSAFSFISKTIGVCLGDFWYVCTSFGKDNEIGCYPNSTAYQEAVYCPVVPV